MNVATLKPQEEWVLLALHDYAKLHSYAPTVRELVRMCGFSSTSVAYYWLTKLQVKGFVDWVPADNRTIHIPGNVTLHEWHERGVRHVEASR